MKLVDRLASIEVVTLSLAKYSKVSSVSTSKLQYFTAWVMINEHGKQQRALRALSHFKLVFRKVPMNKYRLGAVHMSNGSLIQSVCTNRQEYAI